MTAISTMPETHPLAALIPEMDVDQYAEMRDDIARNGLREAIVLHEGMVLDGRHRLRACSDTGTEPQFTEFNGASPVEFVLSMNVKRRHLTASQRAAIAMSFLPAAEEEARKRQQAGLRRGTETAIAERPSGSPDPDGTSVRRAREDVGRMAGVSGATIDRARRVAQEDPEMFEQVKAGTLRVRTADNMLREKVANGSITRDGHRRRPPQEMVANVIEKVLGTVAALDLIDLGSAIAADDVPLEQWDKNLTDIIVPLSRLRGDIRKVLTHE